MVWKAQFDLIGLNLYIWFGLFTVDHCKDLYLFYIRDQNALTLVLGLICQTVVIILSFVREFAGGT